MVEGLSSTVDEANVNHDECGYVSLSLVITDEADYLVIKKLSEQIAAQRMVQKADDKLLKRYRLRDNYTCTDKNISLDKGDTVEVLDTEKQTMWLVRKADEKEKVIFITRPVSVSACV